MVSKTIMVLTAVAALTGIMMVRIGWDVVL